MMIKTKEITLVDCGQEVKNGTKEISPDERQNFLLIMSGTRAMFNIRDKQYNMQPFTFLLLPLDDEPLIIDVPRNASYRYMQLYLTENYLRILAERKVNLMEIHTLPQPITVEEIWKLLMHFIQNEFSICSSEIGEHALQLLMYLLMECVNNPIYRAAEVPHYEKLAAVRHNIYTNPGKHWRIQEICNELEISRPYFHKLYLEAFGTTCTQDVIASRIAYSRKLLTETDEVISNISKKCGFETDVYFMRQFKRHVGMTPSAYRKVCKENQKKEQRK